MANAFAKAAAKTATAPRKTGRPQTLWPVTGQLGESIAQLIELQGQRKAIETKESIHKSRLKAVAEDRYLEAFAAAGAVPDSPMLLANEQGQTITFVVQDRATGYDVKDDMADALGQVLGPDGAADILQEQTVYGFNPAVMLQQAKDGSGREVQDVLGERLLGLLDEMRVEGLLDQDQQDQLLTAKSLRTFKPGTIDRLAETAGRNVPRMKLLLQAMAGAVVRYVKP